ncbi:MAG TPA: SBBP repeat-containing protein [Bryobacteraceae bacterium]
MKIYPLFLLLSLASTIPGAASEFTVWIAGSNSYKIARVATDSAGDTIIAGTRTLPYRSTDIFIVRLDPAGDIVLYREISGGASDQATDMALDSAGNIYVAGSTSSPWFPLVNAMQTTPGPGFLFKMSADGNQFLWSTYYREPIAGLAVDTSGDVYITGSTVDTKYPVTAGLPANPVVGFLGPTGAFLTKITPAGDQIVYSTVIAGSGVLCPPSSSCFLSSPFTKGVAVAVNSAGEAFMAGNTDAAKFPATTGAAVTSGTGAFVAAVKADGSGMKYVTLIGPGYVALGGPEVNPGNVATAIAADEAGNAYLTGTTFDTQFPATTGAHQTAFGGPEPGSSLAIPATDAFALKLNNGGTQITWASYLGGNSNDTANSIALDASGQVWIAGTTSSATFPDTQGVTGGGDFVAGFSTSGATLNYSARFPNHATSRSIAIDATGVVHVAGPTGTVSTLQPTGPIASRILGIANAANGPLDGRLAPTEVISIYGPHIGPATPAIASADSTGNLPTQLAGYQVVAGGTLLPILYVSDSQINAIETSPSVAVYSVRGPSGSTPDFNGGIVTSRPEIFRNADNSVIAINQDGTLNSQTNPAVPGTVEAMWMTGSGVLLGVNPGQIATGARDYHCCSVVIGGNLESADYGGEAPGTAIGVSQVNFHVNPTTYVGPQPTAVDLQVQTPDGTKSLPVSLWVTH